jgi:AraC-like DNA-binding protein
MAQPFRTPTIRANVLASILAELARQGADADALLRTHLEDVEPIRDPYQEVPLDRYAAFFEAAADAVDDVVFGAKFGVGFQPEELGPLGIVFVAAPSLRVALNRLGFFLRAWQGGTIAELEVGRETAEWSYRIEDPAVWPRRQDAEFSLSATCSFIRGLLGPGWTPVEIQLEHSAPRGTNPRAERALAQIFKAPVLFDQGANRIVLTSRDLDRPLFDRRRTLSPYLEQHLRDLMSPTGSDRACADRIRGLLSRRIGRRPVDLPSIAASLGLSRRTLQRRLRTEGVSLRDLVREHRLGLAQAALQTGEEPIGSIAASVGYSDAAVFSRAFRSWRGCAPREVRRQEAKPPAQRP